MYTYIEICEGIYAIQEEMTRMYLICGQEKALLLDTGYGSGDLRSLVTSLYDGPVIVAHTHAHSDHIGSDGQFPVIYANPAEWDALLSAGIPKEALQELQDGDIFDLGRRKIEAWYTPGHTKGGMTFLDWDDRIIFSGDLVSDRPIYMFMEGADLREYKMSVEWLISLEPYFDTLCGCHGLMMQSFEQAKKLSLLKELVTRDLAEKKQVELSDGRIVLEQSSDGASMYRPLE